MERSGDVQWPIDMARSRVAEFAAQLRTVKDGDTPVPNLEWSVANLGQHVAGLPAFWSEQHEGGDVFERPADFKAYSESFQGRIDESDPSKLADLIESEFAGFLTAVQERTGDHWLYGLKTNADNMFGLVINETVLHGRDLAAVTGQSPPMFDTAEANLAVGAMMATTPAFIDEAKAKKQKDGVYHVKFRGGKDFTWTKRGGTLTIEEGIPKKPDAKLNTDPAMFLMSSLGRVSQIQAALSGKMFSYGRKPWRFLGLATMAIDGV